MFSYFFGCIRPDNSACRSVYYFFIKSTTMQNFTVREKAELPLSIAQLTKLLLLIVLMLAVLNVIGHVAQYVLGFGAIELLHMNRESNVPTFFSSSILLFSATLLLFTYYITNQQHDKDRNYWLLLSVIFTGLSIDEAVSIHERLGNPVQQVVGIHKWFYYAWVIPAGLLLVVLGIGLFKFLMRLPTDTRTRFLIAGGLYVGGALGVEMIGGYYHFLYGQENITYNLIATLEETLEMLGVVFFIRAILLHCKHHLGGQFSLLIK